MKIAIIPGGNFKYKKGGSELQCQNLGHFFSENGHEVIFINIVDNHDIPEEEKNDKCYMYNFKKTKILKFDIINSLRVLSIEKPDVIYTRVIKWLPHILLISKLLRIPVVYNISSNYDVQKYGVKQHSEFIWLEKIKKSFSFYFTDQIIAQTFYQKIHLNKNFNRESTIIRNCHLVPSTQFKKVFPPEIVWIAKIKPWKQPEIFIKIAENCQDLNAQFIYAGRPSEKRYQTMLIEKTNKLTNIKYLGEISFEKTNELLSKASLFINTSRSREGFPNTYIQSWLRETPVVTLNFDPDDLIKKHKIGLHSGTFEQLLKDIRYLIENEGIRRKMGKEARKYAVKNHDIEKIWGKYLKIFDLALDS